MSTYPSSPADIGLAQIVLPPVDAKQSIDLATVREIAQELVESQTLPTNIKTRAQAVAIILAGREMGIEPLLALRSISIDRGKIIIAADLQFGMFKRDGGHAEWVQNDITGVALHLRHMNGDEYLSTFTPEDAERASLWGKVGTWSKYPIAMMRARAITAGLKAVGYTPTAGAYDDVSEELPPATRPASAPGEALCKDSSKSSKRTALLTLCDIDEAIQELAFVCREDANIAESRYTELKPKLEGSELRARRFLERLRRRIDELRTAPRRQPYTNDYDVAEPDSMAA